MARPVTHGAGWLARRLEKNRLEPRVRRMLNKLQRELHAQPWESLRAMVLGRIARRELLIQQREAHLLADPEAEGGKWLLGLWAAHRRDIELLALLERLAAEGEQAPSLQAYLAAKAGTNGPSAAQTAPPAATHAETLIVADDAADATQGSDSAMASAVDEEGEGR